jgi:hypothetical protein
MRFLGVLFSLVFAHGAFAQSITFPGPGGAVVGAPVPVSAPTGIGSTLIGTAPPGSFTFSTTANIVSGNFLFCYVAWGTNGIITVASISDGTNSYTSNASLKGNAGSGTASSELWFVANASAVSSGGTITVTMSGAGSGANEGTVTWCGQAAHVATSSPFDQGSVITTNSSTPSITTGTLAKSNSIVIGASYNNNLSTPTYTESSGFTNLFSNTGVIGESYGIGYKITAATTAVTYAPTWSATASVAMLTTAGVFKGQ